MRLVDRDFHTLDDLIIFPHDDHTNIILFEVKGSSQDTILKLDQLLGLHIRQGPSTRAMPSPASSTLYPYSAHRPYG